MIAGGKVIIILTIIMLLMSLTITLDFNPLTHAQLPELQSRMKENKAAVTHTPLKSRTNTT